MADSSSKLDREHPAIRTYIEFACFRIGSYQEHFAIRLPEVGSRSGFFGRNNLFDQSVCRWLSVDRHRSRAGPLQWVKVRSDPAAGIGFADDRQSARS